MSRTSPEPMNKLQLSIALSALVLLGFALRLYQLDSVPFRGDEAFNALYWAGVPLSESLTDTISREPFPPLGYVLKRGWGLIFGIDSEWTLRLLSVFASLLAIPAIFDVGRRLFGTRAGLLVAALWAVHPYAIWHAQEFRLYGIWTGLSTVLFALGLRVMAHRRQRDWIAYGAVALISVMIFYFELMTLGILGLYVLLFYHQDRRFVVRWSLLNGALIGLALLTFLVFQGQMVAGGGYGGTSGGVDLRALLGRFLPVLMLGDTLPDDLLLTLAPVCWVVIGLALIVVWRRDRQTAVLLALWAFVPLLLVGLIAPLLITFDPRYALVAAPAYMLLLAGLITRSQPETRKRGRWGRFVRAGLLAGWGIVAAFSLSNHYRTDVFVKTVDWRAMGDYLAENVQSDDVVVQTSVDSAFAYYYRSPAPETSLPAYITQPAADIKAQLDDLRDQHDSLWIVGLPGRDWPNAGVVDTWLADNMQRVRSTLVGDLPVRQYKTWQVADDEMGGATPIRFGDVVTLVGSRVFMPPEPTGEITVWLYWRPLQQTESPLIIFLHLVGDVNPATGTPLWAQSDWPPLRGQVQTTDWDVGRVYRDVFTLTVRDIPAGEYSIFAGWYDPETLDRLMMQDGRDAALIETVTLE